MASINLKQYYAAHAPAMPDWFVEKCKEDEPKLPTYDHLSPGDREQFKSLVAGTLDRMDASLEAQALFKQYQAAQGELRRWAREQHQDAFFAWRWFYAEQMMLTEPTAKEASDAKAA
jgi:hypothetical protein